MTEDEEQEKRGFKVEDRRRFSESGEARPEPHAAATQPAVEAPAAPRPAHAEPHPPFAMSFSTFVISLSTQVLVHLGEIPNPGDNTLAVDLVAAKQLIDILGILKDKTQGNLDASESPLLQHILYDLRIKYVEQARKGS